MEIGRERETPTSPTEEMAEKAAISVVELAPTQNCPPPVLFQHSNCGCHRLPSGDAADGGSSCLVLASGRLDWTTQAVTFIITKPTASWEKGQSYCIDSNHRLNRPLAHHSCTGVACRPRLSRGT